MERERGEEGEGKRVRKVKAKVGEHNYLQNTEVDILLCCEYSCLWVWSNGGPLMSPPS